MPRPKGSFKTPEQLAAMTAEERANYKRHHNYYVANKERLERERRRIPSWRERKLIEQDAALIEWDTFPESLLREWLRNNVPTVGACRFKAARWGTNNSNLSKFLQGRRMLSALMLQSISIDTGVSIEQLLAQHHEAALALKTSLQGDK